MKKQIIFLFCILLSVLGNSYVVTNIKAEPYEAVSFTIGQNIVFFPTLWGEPEKQLLVTFRLTTTSGWNSTNFIIFSCVSSGRGSDEFLFQFDNASLPPSSTFNHQVLLNPEHSLECYYKTDGDLTKTAAWIIIPSQFTIPDTDAIDITDKQNAFLDTFLTRIHTIVRIIYLIIEIFAILIAIIVIPVKLFDMLKWSYTKLKGAVD